MSNSNRPLVAIVILNWNGWRDTRECVSACRKLEWPNFRILLVDNHSTDGSVELLRRSCPDLEIVETGANLGFAGGNNIGIQQALNLGADYIWLLNNDAMPAPGALAPLVDTLQKHPSAACAASKIYYHDDPQRIWFTGGAWSRRHLRLRQQGAGQIEQGQFDDVREIGSVTGCSMLIAADKIKTVGMLAEDYFLYWEDTDWSARAQKQGYQLLLAPGSHVWHKVSATITPRSALQYYYYIRNGLYFCCRHDPLSLPLLLLYTTTDVCVGLLKGNFRVASGYIRGIADFVRGRRGQQVTP